MEKREQDRMSKVKVLLCFMVDPNVEKREETKGPKYGGEKWEGDRSCIYSWVHWRKTDLAAVSS